MRKLPRVLVFFLALDVAIVIAALVYTQDRASNTVNKANPTRGAIITEGDAQVARVETDSTPLTTVSAPVVSAQELYFRERRDIFEHLPQHEGAIVFLGDSHIEKCHWHELPQNPDVVNRGIGRDVINEVKERLPEVLRHHPRQVFLMVGINDIIAGAISNQIVFQYQDLVKAIRKNASGTRIIMQSVLPVNQMDWANVPADLAGARQKAINTAVIEVNQGLSKLADKNHIIYADIRPRLSDKDQRLDSRFTKDGLHLNGSGYQQWALQIRPLLRTQGG